MPPKEAKKSGVKRGSREPLSLSDEQLRKVAERVAEQLQGLQRSASISSPSDSVTSGASATTTASSGSSETTMSTAAGNVAFHLGADSVSVTSTESVFQALDGNVPDDLKQKIINGEYIDLGQLLQRRPGPDKSRCLTIEDGHLVVQLKPFTMKIPDINHWTDAFLIFASIFSSAHPESTSGLFKYMHTVRLGAKRSSGLGFKFYDEQYRLRKVSNPSSSWGIVDQELWLLYMFYGNQSGSPSFSTGSRNLKCYTFNFSGSCSKPQCFYVHKCLACSGAHLSVRCMSRPQQNVYSDFRQVGPSPQSSGARFPGVRPPALRPPSNLTSVRPARGALRLNNLRPFSN